MYLMSFGKTSALRSAKHRPAKPTNTVPRTCPKCPILNMFTSIDGARRPQKAFRLKTQQGQIGIQQEFIFLPGIGGTPILPGHLYLAFG